MSLLSVNDTPGSQGVIEIVLVLSSSVSGNMKSNEPHFRLIFVDVYWPKTVA